MMKPNENNRERPERILRKLSYLIIGLCIFCGILFVPLHFLVKYAEARNNTYVFPGASNVLIILISVAVISIVSVILVYRFQPDKVASEKITILILLLFIIISILVGCRLFTLSITGYTSVFSAM